MMVHFAEFGRGHEGCQIPWDPLGLQGGLNDPTLYWLLHPSSSMAFNQLEGCRTLCFLPHNTSLYRKTNTFQILLNPWKRSYFNAFARLGIERVKRSEVYTKSFRFLHIFHCEEINQSILPRGLPLWLNFLSFVMWDIWKSFCDFTEFPW